MQALIENPQPRDWFFWLGETAWDDVPYLISVPLELGEKGLLPGGITYVADPPVLAWWRP